MESVLFDGQDKMVVCMSQTTIHVEDEAMEIYSVSSSMQSVLYEGQEKMDVCASSSTFSLMEVDGGADDLAPYEVEETLWTSMEIEAAPVGGMFDYDFDVSPITPRTVRFSDSRPVGGTFDYGLDVSPITPRTVRFSDSRTVGDPFDYSIEASPIATRTVRFSDSRNVIYEYDPSLPIDTSGHVMANTNDYDDDARKFDINLVQEADDFLNSLGAELVGSAFSDVAKAEAEQYKHSSTFLEYLSPLSAILGMQLSSPSLDTFIDPPDADSADTAFEEPSPSMLRSFVTPSGSHEDVSNASRRGETRYCDIPGAFDLDDFDDDWLLDPSSSPPPPHASRLVRIA